MPPDVNQRGMLLEVLDSTTLGPNRSVYVVRAGEKRLVRGVTQNQIIALPGLDGAVRDLASEEPRPSKAATGTRYAPCTDGAHPERCTMGNRRRRASETVERVLRIWLIGTAVLVLSVGCGGGNSAGAEATAIARFQEGMEGLQGGVERGMPATVTMAEGRLFEPTQVTVPAGTTVLWRNTSSDMHTVTADPARAKTASNVQLPDGAEPFESESLSQGQTFAQQLTVPGEYRYVCRIHEESGMMGTITVE